MAISNDSILQWIDNVSKIKGLLMDPTSLADDVVLMAYVFDVEADFLQAMNNVVRAINQLINETVNTSQLQQNYSRWDCYHFQSQRTQGHRADLRIVFRTLAASSIQVKGFGHRHLAL